jgi:hypothetical protein
MPMEALMGTFRRAALSLLTAFVLTGSALAAPNGTPDPVGVCVSSATTQFNIDYVQCAGLYPPIATELIGNCQALAALKYSQALAKCGNKSSSVRTGVSPALKQNTDSGFLRRLRY